MATIEESRALAGAAIDAAAKELEAISLGIHAHPELNFAEHHAHGLLTDYLERQGFRVERGAYEMSTAFEAVAGSGSPTIAVMCEYDALPGIGHACGHNLIAISGVATGLALKAALGEGQGTIVVLGSPAEEGGGGKEFLIQRGAFEGVDAALMLHPAPLDGVYFNAAALQALKVEYIGRNAHAGFAPWEGVNALDAMVNAYVSISTLRQHIRPTERIHGVITDGGLKPNIVPDHTAAEFYVRALNRKDLDILKARVVACFEGAATATGCELRLQWDGPPYADLVSNGPMAETYREHFNGLGGAISPGRPSGTGGASTDMGNVSYVVPSIHPSYAIPTEAGAMNHTPGFTKFAATPDAHAATFRASKALALTALDLYLQPELLESAKEEFEGVKGGNG